MKILVVDTKDNLELLRELFRVYITEEFEAHVRHTIESIQKEIQSQTHNYHHPPDSNEVCQSYILAIDKVILDNVFRYIAENNISKFLELVNRNMLNMDFYINPFYSKEVIDSILRTESPKEDELDSVTYILNRNISSMINRIYLSNDRINIILMNLFNSFYSRLSYIRFRYYKFDLDHYYRPMLLYSEKEKDETHNS